MASDKPARPIRMFAGFLALTTFLRRHKFWLHRQFSAQFQKRRNDGDGFLCYRRRFVLNSKRLLSTSCNKQGQRSSE